MKYTIYLLIALLLNSCGNTPNISKQLSAGEIETNNGNNTLSFESENFPIIQEYEDSAPLFIQGYSPKPLNNKNIEPTNAENCDEYDELRGARIAINLDTLNPFDFKKKFINEDFDHLGYSLIFEKCMQKGIYDKGMVYIKANALNKETFKNLKDIKIIEQFFNYNLTVSFNEIEDQETLYDFIVYINRNTSIYQIKIEVDDQNLKIDEKLFTEILQNSRFRYSLNLDFSDDFKEIDILRKMHGSNIQALGFNQYSRGVYFDDFYFRGTTNDTVYFTHKGKRAEFDIIDGEEVFTYFEGPGSERIPFEYSE